MARIVFDYLHESIFLNDMNIESKFSKYSEIELSRELIKYRNYILNNKDKIIKEAKSDGRVTSVLPSVIDKNIPSLDTLKQTSLYIHRYLIDDPIFEISLDLELNKNTAVMNQYLGMDNDSTINRIKLSERCLYMKELSYGVYSGFIKFIPASLIHERPEYVPLTGSDNQFEEYTSQSLRNYFYENSKVLSVSKSKKGLEISNDEVREPCRGIAFQLINHTKDISYCYMLFDNEITYLDDKTGHFKMRTYLPQTQPSVEEFNHWVYQSMNQVALNFSTDISKDLILCNDLNSIYFTESVFVSELMQVESMTKSNISNRETNAINYIVNYGIPVIEDVRLNDILKVRNEYGESFEAFRNDLETKTSELRYLKDQKVINSKISEIDYEMKHGYLNDIRKDIFKLSKSAFRNSTIIAGSLGWNMLTSNFNTLASLMAIHQGYVTYKEYKETIKYNPSYFLWKVNKNKLFK